jgi:hypothetical protein
MDSELFAHYVARGGEPWNTSLEAAWLDYELRAWIQPRLPKHLPRARVANLGIGVGLWDDWLGYELGAPITSIDRDPEIRRVFAARQRRERHPYPSRVLAALPAPTDDERFDAITIVGSTLAETGDRDALEAAARAATDLLLIAEVGNREPPAAHDEIRRLGEIWIAFRSTARISTAGSSPP